jgi:polyisoprenoid-binding protein YceI
MRFFVLSLLGFAATLGFASAAQAEAAKYVLDKPHTQILFTVNHLGFSNSVGKFTDYNGFVNFDEATPADSSVEVTIKTASVDLNDAAWNDHMKKPDFFNVEKFPDMTFKSTKVEVTGEKTANITGDLTLLGVTKPVVLATVFNQAGKHPMSGKLGAGFSATGTLKRSDFGMNYGLPMVGDDVKITIEAEAYAEDKATDGTNNQ